MVNALLEIAGFSLLVAFALVVWPPAALLVSGVGLIAAAAVKDRGSRSEEGL